MECEFRNLVALRFAARLGWSKRHRGALMAARLRARAGADDARATSLYLARFACTSPGERLRAFPSGEELIVCRFRLNQPVVSVYKARFAKCATSVWGARFTFQVSKYGLLGFVESTLLPKQLRVNA